MEESSQMIDTDDETGWGGQIWAEHSTYKPADDTLLEMVQTLFIHSVHSVVNLDSYMLRKKLLWSKADGSYPAVEITKVWDWKNRSVCAENCQLTASSW